jgi:excisionase family DNA binding protein
MGKNQTSQIPNILLSVKDASVAISVSSKMVRLLIASGRLKAVNLGKRMTRISLQELTDFAQRARWVMSCYLLHPFLLIITKREKKNSITTAKPETGNVNKRAKCPHDTSQ